MAQTSQLNKDRAKQDLSDCFNSIGAYDIINSISITYFNNKQIDNDSQFWHDLEDVIINLIDEHEE